MTFLGQCTFCGGVTADGFCEHCDMGKPREARMKLVRREDTGERADKPEGCDGCGFRTPTLTRYYEELSYEGHHAQWLCALCAGTKTGNAARWPDIYAADASVLQTICYVGNAILAALDAKVDLARPAPRRHHRDDDEGALGRRV